MCCQHVWHVSLDAIGEPMSFPLAIGSSSSYTPRNLTALRSTFQQLFKEVQIKSISSVNDGLE